MKYLMFSLLLAVPVALSACANQPPPAGGDLASRWALLANGADGVFRSEWTLINNGGTALPGEGWQIFFNFARSVKPESVAGGVKIEQVNGDFYRMSPLPGLDAVAPGETLTVSFDTEGAAINISDAPAGFYIVYDGRAPETMGPYVIDPFDGPDRTSRSAEDHLPVPTAASRFQQNQALSVLARSELTPILPTPVRFARGSGTFQATGDLTIRHAAGLENEAALLAGSLATFLGKAPTVLETREWRPLDGAIDLKLIDRKDGEGSYRLEVLPRRVLVEGQDAEGVFHGTQSLLALIPVSAYRKPGSPVLLEVVTVADAPRFPYRGMHLDVARNFHRKEEVLKLLDLMAFYKLNRFHLHLTDDEGWRLEIPGLPELTEVGSRRGHTEDESDCLVPSYASGPEPGTYPGSGFYSREDYIEILKYAAARHIEVIPEIDLPGHARAAIVSMKERERRLVIAGDPVKAVEYRLHDPDDPSPYRSVQGWTDNVIDVCQDSTYRFLEKVVAEVKAMHDEAGVRLEFIHTGGDEVPAGVWEKAPQCQALTNLTGIERKRYLTGYFLERMTGLLSQHGLRLAGWEEVGLTGSSHDKPELKGPNPAFANRGFLTYAWNSVWGWGGEANAYRLANAGYEVVLSNAPNLYFDLAYEKDPEEPGYYWAGFVDVRNAWEFVPLDLYESGGTDRMGNPIDSARYADAVRPDAEGRKRILGLQGQLWSENARSQELLEYMVFPKLLGMAERAWAPSPAWARERNPKRRAQLEAKDWNQFVNRLGQIELPRFDQLPGGVGYRIAPPGAVIENGFLKANSAYPGLTIRYSTEGREPTWKSPLYSGPVKVDGTVLVRAFDTNGRGSRSVPAVSSEARGN